MRTKTILLALVAMTALFCACDNDEESDFDLKVNQFSYAGKVFDVETFGDWDERMGWLDLKCEAAGFGGSLDHHWDNWESGKTVDLAKDGYPEAFGIYFLDDSVPSALPMIHFYGKEGEIDEEFYENIFKSGTVTYTGGVTSKELTFKLDAVLANGKSLKFWLEFKQRSEK